MNKLFSNLSKTCLERFQCDKSNLVTPQRPQSTSVTRSNGDRVKSLRFKTFDAVRRSAGAELLLEMVGVFEAVHFELVLVDGFEGAGDGDLSVGEAELADVARPVDDGVVLADGVDGDGDAGERDGDAGLAPQTPSAVGAAAHLDAVDAVGAEVGDAEGGLFGRELLIEVESAAASLLGESVFGEFVDADVVGLDLNRNFRRRARDEGAGERRVAFPADVDHVLGDVLSRAEHWTESENKNSFRPRTSLTF